MMTMLASYKQQFAQLLASQFDFDQDQIFEQIQLAPENIDGDLAFPCFLLAKQLGKSPVQIAQDIQTAFQSQELGMFSKIQAVGPYVNAFFDISKLAAAILTKIGDQKSDFGSGLPRHQTILLEGRAPNTHKSIHIGHVRNFLLSESIARILKFAGYEVIKTCYPGDIGAHVAKWIRYYKTFLNEPFPKHNFSKWVGEVYTAATRKADENPDYKQQINGLQKALEDGDKELVQFWKETRELCLAGMATVFAELGTTELDKRYYESQVEQPGIEKVKALLEQGIAELSQGAIVMNLQDYKLGIFLLLKSNGASLYSTKDIALAYQKLSDFPNYDKSLYVVGLEQEHHFQQLFKTLELIGFDHEKLHHISYGLVDLSEGKMSSRAGNIILYEDFRDQVLARAKEVLASRLLPEDQKNQIASDVAFGAMKFGMLLQDSEKGLTFDWEQALSFEGETGPYLQYMYARMVSLLAKAQETQKPDFALLTLEIEKSLLLQLASFPSLVAKSADEYKPNIIARFALGLAKHFASYYHQAKILDETAPALSATRLTLVRAIQTTLKNALTLLGINTPSTM